LIKIIPILFLAIACMPEISQAATFGTGEYLRECWKAYKKQDAGYRLSDIEWGNCCYFMGIVKGVSGLGKEAGVFSIPENNTAGINAAVVGNWLDSHSRSLNERDSILVIKAFLETYPCKDRK
jgi:hypothetical protein